MPSPVLTFAFLIATLIGLIFFVVLSGNGRRLAIFLIASWIGFLLGHFFSISFGVRLIQIGDLHLLTAILGSIVSLFIAYFLTLERN